MACNGKTAALAMRSSSTRKAGGSKSKWGRVEPSARNGWKLVEGIGSPQYNAFKSALAEERNAEKAFDRVATWPEGDPRIFGFGKATKREIYQYQERKRRLTAFDRASRARVRAQRAFEKAFPDSDYPF